MKKTLALFCTCLFFVAISHGQTSKSIKSGKSGKSFSFAFITDIHIQPELNAVEGFTKAIDTLNKLKPEFVIAGGDLIMDALGQTEGRADSLYNLYKKTSKLIKAPLYNTVGNHELFGLYLKNGVTESHPLFGTKMFESKMGKTFQTFTHKGWKFMILNSIDASEKGKYKGGVDSIQLSWIAHELLTTDKKTPVVVILHIPVMTALSQIDKGAYAPNTEGLVVANSKEILDLFKGHNLKLVLQGHLHILEDIFIRNIHFITGGSICGAWWKGPYKGTEEGFLLFNVVNDNFSWKYIDYNWNPAK